MLRSHVLSAVVAVAIVSTGCASTQIASTGMGTLDRIKATKTITLGYRKTSIPFSLEDTGGKPIGYSIDICTRVVEDLKKALATPDLAVKWVPVTVENRMDAVRDGTIDLECGSTTNTLSRQQRVDFSLTTFVTGGSLLALRETTQSLTNLKGLRIAVIPGTTTERVLKEAIKDAPDQVKLIPVKDHAEGRAALENKTADAYASDRDILIGLALTAPDPKRYVLGDRYFSYEPYALMLRRGDVEFRLAVNRSLARLYRSGDILVIYQRWFESLGGPTALLLATYAIEGLPE